MKNIKLLITSLIVLASYGLQAQETYTVKANVKGDGEHYIAILIDGDEQFPGITSTSIVQKGTKTEDGASFSFDGITLGTYALLVFHDENNNGSLDMDGNMPAEAFGYSNYLMMGPPTWKNCSFEVDSDRSFEVKLYQF